MCWSIEVIAVCELLFLKDTFNNRMNTIFKFYYEVWLLLAVAGAYAVAHISQRLRTRSLHYGWLGGVGLLCAAGKVSRLMLPAHACQISAS